MFSTSAVEAINWYLILILFSLSQLSFIWIVDASAQQLKQQKYLFLENAQHLLNSNILQALMLGYIWDAKGEYSQKPSLQQVMPGWLSHWLSVCSFSIREPIIWAQALIGKESEQEEILRQCVGCERNEVIK